MPDATAIVIYRIKGTANSTLHLPATFKDLLRFSEGLVKESMGLPRCIQEQGDTEEI